MWFYGTHTTAYTLTHTHILLIVHAYLLLRAHAHLILLTGHLPQQAV
jgi:hypothetical protein